MARDYIHENIWKSKPEEVAKRSSRNKARAILVVALGPAKMRGKQADHINGNPLDNSRKNLRPISPKANNNGRRGGPATMKGKR